MPSSWYKKIQNNTAASFHPCHLVGIKELSISLSCQISMPSSWHILNLPCKVVMPSSWHESFENNPAVPTFLCHLGDARKSSRTSLLCHLADTKQFRHDYSLCHLLVTKWFCHISPALLFVPPTCHKMIPLSYNSCHLADISFLHKYTRNESHRDKKVGTNNTGKGKWTQMSPFSTTIHGISRQKFTEIKRCGEKHGKTHTFQTLFPTPLLPDPPCQLTSTKYRAKANRPNSPSKGNS